MSLIVYMNLFIRSAAAPFFPGAPREKGPGKLFSIETAPGGTAFAWSCHLRTSIRLGKRSAHAGSWQPNPAVTQTGAEPAFGQT